MPLLRRNDSTVSRTTCSGARSPERDVQGLGKLGVPDRRGRIGRGQPEADRQHHEPARVLLEERGPVRETARVRRQHEHGAVLAIPHPYLAGRCRRPPARTRRRSGSGSAGPPGDAGEALESGQPGVDACGATRSSHVLARGDGDHDDRSAVGLELTPEVRTSTTRPANPSSASTTLLPPPRISTGVAGGVGFAEPPRSTSARRATITSSSAGPPSPRVVYGASGAPRSALDAGSADTVRR